MIEIELNNIKKNYGFKNILDGVNFEIKTGERVALIGPNGCGKSTILKIINGDETQNSGRINIRKGSTIGMLNQIYEVVKENITVDAFLRKSFEQFKILEHTMKELEEKMSITNLDGLQKLIDKYGKIQNEYIRMGGYETEEKYKRICSGFKFEKSFLSRQYNLLSGGEKATVNLASILLKNPNILLLDEPTNHLDIQTLEWLENFLVSYKGTILIVSHDRYFLDKVATKTILLEKGKEKIYFGNYSYFLEEDERRTLAEFEIYKNQQKQIEKMKEAIKLLRKFGEKNENESFFKRAKCIERRLEKMQVVDKVILEKRKIELNIKSSKRSGNEVLKVKQVSKKYGEKVIFDKINLNIYYGEKVCLSGKNGSGKSTLIKMILDNEKNYEGEIVIGSNVKIGYIPQNIEFEKKETILEFFMNFYKGTETECRKFLARFMFFQENVFKKLNELSGGEKVRIKLAELMLKDTNFLILDEPTNHLDIHTREILEETLQGYNGTILFVSHDRYFINKISDKTIEINNNKIL